MHKFKEWKQDWIMYYSKFYKLGETEAEQMVQHRTLWKVSPSLLIILDYIGYTILFENRY